MLTSLLLLRQNTKRFQALLSRNIIFVVLGINKPFPVGLNINNVVLSSFFCRQRGRKDKAVVFTKTPMP